MYNGELWAHGVVQAVLDSPTWDRTLLIYIYDEHGGYYDHVPPPAAIEPDDIQPELSPQDPPGGRYNLYGPRVPAIVVSPYSKAGGVTHVVHDHTSVLATIETKWNLPALTNRDANANTVMDFLDLDQSPLLHPPPLEAPRDTGPSGPVSALPHPAETTSPVPALQAIPATRAPRSRPMTSTTSSQTPAADQLKLTFRITLIGIVAVLIAFIAALIAFHGSKNPGEVIPAVVGVAATAIGTLAGLVAGHASGAAGKAQADQRAANNERDAAAGRALAQSMLVDEPRAPHSASPTDTRFLGTPAAQPETADLARRHAELARSLFPDVN
jgi:hypothetical protein